MLRLKFYIIQVGIEYSQYKYSQMMMLFEYQRATATNLGRSTLADHITQTGLIFILNKEILTVVF
jgi:hypothetical protein